MPSWADLRRSAPVLAVLVLAVLVLAAVPIVPAAAAKLDEAAALAESQQATGRELGDHSFVNSQGKPLRLRDFRGRPVVLHLIYTGCGDSCPLVVERLALAVEVADKAFGKGRFVVLTAGFDPRSDTPRQMRAYADAHGIDRADWELLSAPGATIDRVAAETGFSIIARAGGFDHVTQVTLLDPEGRVYRQIYGTDFSPQSLVEPLKQLLFGQRVDGGFAGLLNRVRLLCTIYDPAAGRYRFSYAVFLELGIGAASLAAVGFFVLRLWLQTRRAKVSRVGR